MAPVLEGSESRRRHPRKGTSVDRVCVLFVSRVDRRIFSLRQKRIHSGSTYAGGNNAIATTPYSGANTPLAQCHAWLGATQYSAACQLDGGRQAAGWEAGKERERMEDGSEGERDGSGGREQGKGVRKR